jgi:hypothetical protein
MRKGENNAVKGNNVGMKEKNGNSLHGVTGHKLRPMKDWLSETF